MRTGRNVLSSFGGLHPCLSSHSCHTRPPLCLMFEAGLVLGSELPGPSSGSQEPPPRAGPPAQTWQGEQEEQCFSTPPKCCAGGPEIKIKCSFQRQRGGRSSSRPALGLHSSTVTSHPNLWHVNYSPSRLFPGPEGELTLSLAWGGAATAWTPNPQAAPRKLVGPGWLLPPASTVPEEAASLALGSMRESLSLLHLLLHLMVATVLS